MNTVFDKARDLATALLESEAGKKVKQENSDSTCKIYF